MSSEEIELRNRFNAEYAPCLKEFFAKVDDLGYTDDELWAVPGVFLPGCGSLYAQSLVKVAFVGEGTNDWNDCLRDNIRDWKNGCYNMEFSFDRLQQIAKDDPERLCDGPTKWRNLFWQYLSEILNAIYQTSDALDPTSPIFRGISWGNRHAVEVYKPSGKGGAIAIDKITPEKVARLDRIADECGLTSLERFIRVFEPSVVVYTCHNKKGGSDAVIPRNAKPVDPPYYPKQGSAWVVKTYRWGATVIVQTQHSSWVKRYGGVDSRKFGHVIADVMRKYGLCTPPAKEHFYYLEDDASCQVFSALLNARAEEIFSRNEWADKRFVSYQLALALADHLYLTNSTMTAALFVRLLNRVERFKQSGWQYSPERRGPCAVAAGAWRYFQNGRQDAKGASKIAQAFRRLDGGVAW